jgi:hypothetical protein
LQPEAEAIIKQLPLEFYVLVLRLGRMQWTRLCKRVEGKVGHRCRVVDLLGLVWHNHPSFILDQRSALDGVAMACHCTAGFGFTWLLCRVST